MSTEGCQSQPSLNPSLAFRRCHVSVIPSIRNHCRDHLPISCTHPFNVFVKNRLLGYATVEWYAPPVFLPKWRSMIGAPQDCKPSIDFCIVLSNQNHPFYSRSVRAVWSTWSKFNPPAQLLVGTGPGKPLCCRRCASRHRSSTSKSVTGTQSLSRSTMCRPGKTRQRAAKTKVPAHVW